MPISQQNKLTARRSPAAADATHFLEAPAWKSVGGGWRPLFARYQKLGFSFEWHEFTTPAEFDWSRSFHPGSVEICLNLEGTAQLADVTDTVALQPQTFAFYYQGTPPLKAARRLGVHRFITLELSPEFLRRHFAPWSDHLHPVIRAVISDAASASAITPPESLATSLQHLVETLRHCPVFEPAQEIWFQCKALEVATQLFFRPQGGELFCSRTERLARDRVERAKLILRERMSEPPSLEELSQMVSISPSYLSRMFAKEAGVTMQQYLRRIRLERAAELLRTGRCNVTEASIEVGYNSLSHFSTAFHEMFGCCPGLYPFRTSPQQKKRS